MLPWNELARLIDQATHILITTHVRPDGDALGSELALAELLLQKGKSVEILNSSPTPQRYSFLDPDAESIACIDPTDPRPKGEPDLFIVVDTGTWSQLAGLAPYVRTLECPKAVIDHHVTQDDLGALRLVDTSAAAAGMLIYEAHKQLAVPITRRSAEALFVAIAMDTGWMRHPNASPSVFQAMSDLVERGARPHEIYRLLFEQNRIQRLKLMSVLFDHAELRSDGRLVTSYILWDEITSLGAHPMETEDFINELMTIAGVEVAALFIGQLEGGTKLSLRSRSDFDCAAFAAARGGGGHKAAAGASLSEGVTQVRPTILADIERTLTAK